MVILKESIKEKWFYVILLISILLFHLSSLSSYFTIEIVCSANESGSVQIFYDDGSTGFLETKSVIGAINTQNTTNIEVDTKEIQSLRLDFDGIEKIDINAIRIKHGKNIITEINSKNYNDFIRLEHDCLIEKEQEVLSFISNGNDSYLVFDTGRIVGEKVFFFLKLIFRFLKYICIILLLFLIYKLGVGSKLCSANTRFVLLASLFGIIYSFAIIPWQTPDEWTHLKMIGEGFNNPSLVDVLHDDMPFNEYLIKFHNENTINDNDLISVMTKKPSYTLADCMPRGVSYEFFRHFPAAIGIMLGILLRLPTYWVLQLGELFSLIFYIIVCNYTLKITPIKKSIFEVVMLLPMCIQQASSINYDSVLLPLSFFFVAYILYLKFEKEEIVVKDFVILGVTLLGIVMTKLPYGIIGLLMFMLPWEKIAFSGRLKMLSNMNKSLRVYGGGGIFGILVLIGLYILRNYYFVKLCITSIMYFPRTIQLFSDTLKHLGDTILLSLLGNFGWLDTPIPLRLAMLVFSVLAGTPFITTNNSMNVKNKFSMFEKLIVVMSIILMLYTISISMVSHSVLIFHLDDIDDNTIMGFEKIFDSIPYIVGLQGRYYIPLILPIGILIPNVYKAEKESYSKFILAIESLIFVSTSLVIVQRYFG